jgi:sulfur carrier protein
VPELSSLSRFGGYMFIKVNGEEIEVAGDLSVQILVTDRKLNPKTIIIEMNDHILKPDLWGVTILKPKDKLEIIRIIGGG